MSDKDDSLPETRVTSADQSFSSEQQIICSIIPGLSNTAHKGQCGRIGVIGGSIEYTGAPYFAAISALKVGADLSYVFCSRESAPVIKSYSPELIVYPTLDSDTAVDEIVVQLPKLHAVVIGPGLGRNDQTLANVGAIIDKVKELNLPMILDADALYFVSKCPEIVRGYTKAILTPNVAEFDRLYASVYRCESNKNDNPNEALIHLAKTLGNITIVRKGYEDVISDGNSLVTCNDMGSPRRCGGQGDLLAGSMGVFAYWSHKAFENNSSSSDLNRQQLSPTIIAALAASMLTRRCARLAFAKWGRSTTTTDLIKEIKSSFTSLYPID
ncbi:ATP-dependent (S)-NAD(P)H-hydrate dehydratase-like [Oppia nitens]|uniref:ATP-dependent (S)-NAD(P)H-hydrate dehydratase-like n=1 Tax=Oppia nitens TaxID=1686743 RepID=UPI0023DC03E7|nr:ATP-dependent (S)-NAD(P)H-hydrate dehydratase-like [Oppia nitens]